MTGVLAGTNTAAGDGNIRAKRSLFNKPSWSKPQAVVAGNDLFHRSNQTYFDLASEVERQRKRKQAKKVKNQVREAESDVRPGKRLRVTESESEDDDDSSTDERSHTFANEETTRREIEQQSVMAFHAESSPKLQSRAKSFLERYEADLGTKQPLITKSQTNIKSHTINLEIDVDEEPLTDGLDTAKSSVVPKVTAYDDPEIVSDEEFPELARQAREKARRKRLEQSFASTTPYSPNTSHELSPKSYHSIPSSHVPDPVVQILITSNIPDTEPLIVNRRISQRLKDVRLAWLERQRFPSDLSAKVFLTWRRKRLFDVTSCNSLGFSAGPTGGVLISGEYVGDDEGRIHMEAMTPELLEASRKAHMHEAQEEGSVQDRVAASEKTSELQIRIICKARGYADFKLIVRPVGTG